MDTYILGLFFVIVSVVFIEVHADGFDDLIGSRGDSTFDDLDGLPKLTGLGAPRRPSYTLSSYRSHRNGLNMGARRGHIHSLPDLINLVLGMGGHVVGTAGSIVHGALNSLFGGLFPSMRKPLSPGLFGLNLGRDDLYDDRDLGFGRGFGRDDRYDDRDLGFGRMSGRDGLFDDRDLGFGGLSDDVFGGLDF